MSFDKAAWQREYRKKKKEEQIKNEDNPESDKIDDPDLSLEELPKEQEQEDKDSNKKIVKEDIKKPPAKKSKKKGTDRIPLNPEAFAKMSVSIEKLTLQVHKDKELKNTEQEFIESSSRQLAELYEMPKIIVVVQYVISMLFPHLTRVLKAQAEKIELENGSKKLDLEEKKRKVEQGRQETKEVYQSIGSGVGNGN